MVPAMGLILEAKLLVAHLLQQLPAHAPAPSFQSVPNGSVETLAETMKSTQTNKHQAGELRALPAGRARRRPSPDARGGQGGAGHGADGPGAFTAGSEPRARRRAARRPPRVRAHPPPAGGARCAARRPPRLAATACRPSGPSGAPGLPPDSERPLPDPRVESPHRTAVQGGTAGASEPPVGRLDRDDEGQRDQRSLSQQGWLWPSSGDDSGAVHRRGISGGWLTLWGPLSVRRGPTGGPGAGAWAGSC